MAELMRADCKIGVDKLRQLRMKLEAAGAADELIDELSMIASVLSRIGLRFGGG